MPTGSNEWRAEQMQAAGVRPEVRTAVLRLFEVWDTMNHTAETAAETAQTFASLAVGHAIFVETPKAEEQWVDAQPGALVVGDVVRVKSNAFDGSTGEIHNGRVGRIVGIRYGDIIVKTSDSREPHLDAARYSPHHLEKRVK